MSGRAKRSHAAVIARVAVDAALAVVFVAVMATALVQEAPHEYLGLVAFALMVAHVALNRRWFARLARGRYNAVRVLQVVAITGLAVCVIGQVASAFVLSKHALWFLPALPGTAVARRIHMLCSYWSFVFAFAHAGLQLKGVLARIPKPRDGANWRRVGVWVLRIALAVVACCGAISFAQLKLPSYLLGQVQFAYVDLNAPLALAFAQWAAVAVLVAGVFHYLRKVLEKAGRAGGTGRAGRADRAG